MIKDLGYINYLVICDFLLVSFIEKKKNYYENEIYVEIFLVIYC